MNGRAVRTELTRLNALTAFFFIVSETLRRVAPAGCRQKPQTIFLKKPYFLLKKNYRLLQKQLKIYQN